MLCMDGDDAGQRAVERLCESPASSGLDSLSEAGVSISVASIPGDSGCKDPADYLQVCNSLLFFACFFSVMCTYSYMMGKNLVDCSPISS